MTTTDRTTWLLEAADRLTREGRLDLAAEARAEAATASEPRPRFGQPVCDYPGCSTYSGGPAGETLEQAREAHEARYHAPVITGCGLTESLPQDRYGYVVLRRTDTTATLLRLPSPQDMGHAAACRQVLGFPVWSYTYTQTDLDNALELFPNGGQGLAGPITTARLRKDGRWYITGSSTPLAVDGARYHRDYSY